MKKCKICRSESEAQEFSIREMMFGFKDVFKYFECSNCGCLQIEFIPSDIGKYYDSKNYYSFTHNQNWLNFNLKRERAKFYMNRGGFIGRIISRKKPSKAFEAIGKLAPARSAQILDVGCGDGEILYLLSKIGYSNLLGIDPYIDNDRQFENGLEIKKIDIADLDPGRKWDIIMLHHVFEHIANPLETLISIKERLNPSGVAMIRIPTVSSYAWKHYRENWFQLDAPRHSFLHSKKSMEILAKESGLIIKDCYYDSSAMQFWASEQYQQDIPLMSEKSYAQNPKGSIFSAEQIREFATRSEQLNNEGQGDQIVFILGKD